MLLSDWFGLNGAGSYMEVVYRHPNAVCLLEVMDLLNLEPHFLYVLLLQ